MPSTQLITKADLKKIETSIQKVLDDNHDKINPAYLELLNKIVDTLNELRLTVEFDHEQRLKAIEDYLSDL